MILVNGLFATFNFCVVAGMVLDIVLKEFIQIRDSRDTTVENKAIKRVHEKMVTDVVCCQ